MERALQDRPGLGDGHAAVHQLGIQRNRAADTDRIHRSERHRGAFAGHAERRPREHDQTHARGHACASPGTRGGALHESPIRSPSVQRLEIGDQIVQLLGVGEAVIFHFVPGFAVFAGCER